MGNKQTSDIGWIQCKELSSNSGIVGMTQITVTSKNTFVIASSNIGIHEYNIENDEWIKINDYPSCLNDLYNPSYFLDIRYEILYIYYKPNWQLIRYDIKNDKLEFTEIYRTFGLNAKVLAINNKLHIVGGTENNQHLIWIEEKRRFKVIHTFNEFERGIPYFHDLIYIKTKNIMLLFDDKLSVVYQFDIDKYKWDKVLISGIMPTVSAWNRENFGITTVSNDEFVLIFGGFGTDEILIFSLKTHQFTKSPLKCPTKSPFKAVMISNKEESKLIVSGFVREQCDIYQISMDILKLIESWYSTEIIHLINVFNGQHWKINAVDIFS